MNYYYDLFLNFTEDNLLFYEWDSLDVIDYFKRIPIFLVNSKTLNDFINYKVAITKEFLETIRDKSKVNKDETGNYALFTDKNGAIALEFNENGQEIARSFLNIEDELGLLETIYTLKIETIEYQKITRINHNDSLRKESRIKQLIGTEIKSLINNGDYKKLGYLYMEWFSKIAKNEKEMINTINKALQKSIGNDEIRVYNLIKLSYSNV